MVGGWWGSGWQNGRLKDIGEQAAKRAEMGPTVSLGWRPPTSQPPPQWKRVQSSRRPIRAARGTLDWGGSRGAGSRYGGTRQLSPTPPVARPHALVLLHCGLHRKAAGTQRLANLRRHLPHIVLREIVHRRDGCLVMVAEQSTVHQESAVVPNHLYLCPGGHGPALASTQMLCMPHHTCCCSFSSAVHRMLSRILITVPQKVTAGTGGSSLVGLLKIHTPRRSL